MRIPEFYELNPVRPSANEQAQASQDFLNFLCTLIEHESPAIDFGLRRIINWLDNQHFKKDLSTRLSSPERTERMKLYGTEFNDASWNPIHFFDAIGPIGT